MDDQLDGLRRLLVEYKMFTPEEVLQLDACDLYAVFASELETRFELEQSLKEMFGLFTKRTQKRILSDKIGVNTKIWYQQYLMLKESECKKLKQ